LLQPDSDKLHNAGGSKRANSVPIARGHHPTLNKNMQHVLSLATL